MGSLRNNEILRCSSFSVTRIGMAGSLTLLEVVSWAQSWSMAVGITLHRNGRISACELDTTFPPPLHFQGCISCSHLFPLVPNRLLWRILSSGRSTFFHMWEILELLEPMCRSSWWVVKCSQFGVAPNDFPSCVKRELFSSHCCPPSSFIEIHVF